MQEPPDFTGDLDGYLEWAKDNMKPSPMFCARHWAPCPVEGKAGMILTVLMMQAFIAYLVPADVGDMPEPQRSQQLNSLMENRTAPACCELGDEYMDAMWAEAESPSSRPPFPPPFQGNDAYAQLRAENPREGSP